MLLDEKREHVAFLRTHLFTDDKVKAIVAPGPHISRPQRTINYIMVGERNHIQIRMMLDVMQNLLNSCCAYADQPAPACLLNTPRAGTSAVFDVTLLYLRWLFHP